jgi:hypothetical protein
MSRVLGEDVQKQAPSPNTRLFRCLRRIRWEHFGVFDGSGSGITGSARFRFFLSRFFDSQPAPSDDTVKKCVPTGDAGVFPSKAPNTQRMSRVLGEDV